MALTKVSSALFILFVYDFVFLLILVALVAILSGTKRAAFAVMKRNFVGYFSNHRRCMFDGPLDIDQDFPVAVWLTAFLPGNHCRRNVLVIG